jgi:hypothetical protein
LYQEHLPTLETERIGDTLHLRWTNTGDAAFEVPVPVRIDGATHRVDMTGGTGEVAVPEGTEEAVDPKGWLLWAQ